MIFPSERNLKVKFKVEGTSLGTFRNVLFLLCIDFENIQARKASQEIPH